MIGCEDRLQNDLYCVEWGVKLYSIHPAAIQYYSRALPLHITFIILFMFSFEVSVMLQLILAAGIRQSVKKPDLEHP